MIRAVCAPQDVFVKVSLKHELSCWSAVVQVAAGSAEGQLCFECKAWRNAYAGRLDGVRMWQKRHHMPAVPVIQSRDAIVHGVEKVGTHNAGTGQWMSVWMGWMPTRAKVALFELESDRFILRPEKLPQKAEDEDLPHRAELENSHETTRNPASRKEPVEEKRSPIAYKQAEGPELLHASVIVQQAILKLREKERNGNGASFLSGDEVLRNEIMLQ